MIAYSIAEHNIASPKRITPNRDIHYNSLIVHEILSMFEKKCRYKEYMTITLDTKKVYDRMNRISK